MNALEISKKDNYNSERSTASSALLSEFINFETVGNEIEVIDGSSEQLKISDESRSNINVQANPVTHINIQRERPLKQSDILQSKPGLARRVTGANRVVPFITSLWQKGELRAFEPTVYSVYKAILDNPDNSEERLCEICHSEFLSSTEVEAHVRDIHRNEYIMPQQCFVCTKMYVFETQLKRHLSNSHGIQYPEMICKICFMEFNTAMEKKAHERKHDKIYSCQFCSSKFASEYSWQKHYTEHLTAKKPYQCTKCGKRFHQRILLILHKQRHIQCWCSLCHFFFNELQFLLHLVKHLPAIQRNFLNSIEKRDQEESQFEEVMNTYFRTKSSSFDSWKFKEVDRDVSGCVDSMVNAVSDVLEVDLQPSELPQKNGVKCKLCGLEMTSATELLEHRRKSHLRSRTCPFCGKRSRSVSQTFRHMKTHVGKWKSNKGATQSSKIDINENENIFECQLCNKVFPSKGKQNYHLEAIHKMNIVSRPYSCVVCERKFQFKAARNRHMLLHSKEKNACWKCAVCDQAFLRPKFLLRHVKEHKTEFVCEVCNKTFSKKAKLTQHFKSHNTFIPRFKCSVCPVTSLSITTLREHIRVHTDERPYSCDQCELKFKRSQALKQHMMNIHNGPGSTSYVCSLCAVTFNRKGNLMRHILSYHKGVRRFICGLCGNRYGQKQDLAKHLNSKHQMQLEDISVIGKKSVEVYVYPPLEALPPSDAQYINLIIAEEALKIQKFLALESDTNNSTDIEHTLPLKNTVQMLNVKQVSSQENVNIQSKEVSESITNKGFFTLVEDHSYIPLLSFHICTQCNNVTFRKYQSITDHENNGCEQCCNVREELPDLRAEPIVIEPGIVITEQRSVSLENLSSSNSEAAINDRLINEVLTTEFEEYLYENLASLMNPDLDGASDQMPIKNLMLQPSSAVPSKFSNENLLMITSNPPSTTVHPADNNSPSSATNSSLNNPSSLKMDTVLLPFTSPEISAETDNYQSDKSPEEEKNDNISADKVNKNAHSEAENLPFNNLVALPPISSAKISVEADNWKSDKASEEEKNYSRSVDMKNKKGCAKAADLLLDNLSNLKMDGSLPPCTSPGISAETDNSKSSEEEKNDNIYTDTPNKKAYPEVADLPLNNLSSFKMSDPLPLFSTPETSVETDNCKSNKLSDERNDDISADAANKETYAEAADLPLYNLSSLKTDVMLPHIFLPETSAKSRTYKSKNSSEEQKNNNISADTGNRKAYPETTDLLLNNLSSFKMVETMPPFTSPEISTETGNCKSNKLSGEQKNGISADTEIKNVSTKLVDLPLNSLSSLKMCGASLSFTSPKIFVETGNCKSRSSEEEKSVGISEDPENKKDYPEISSSGDLLPQISHTSLTPSDTTESNIYSCKLCKKKCDQKSALERHMKVHSGDTPFKCETCERPFKLKHNLIVHSRTHTGERRYECLQCSKSFRYHKDLLNHKKRHQGLKPYLCAECGKQFFRLAYLKRHEDIHSSKRYQCPVCHKLFKRLDHMKMVHMKTHEKTSTKTFECEQCKKNFFSRFALRKHNLLHSGMKTHSCTICGKSFVLKMYLESHMKTHVRQENYVQCPRCPRKFVSESTCQIHISKFHRININAEEEQQIAMTNTDTEMGYFASTVINAGFDFVNTEAMKYDSLEDQSCNAVIYIEMLVENKVPLHD